MKTNEFIRIGDRTPGAMLGTFQMLAVAGALVLTLQTGSAQTWSTVDDFQYSLGTNSHATGLAKDPSGAIIYSAGDGQDASGVGHALAFKSLDGGATWSLMDDYLNPAIPLGYWVGYRAGIATDPLGNIYAAGNYELSTGRTTWFTRRSVDGGTNWTTVDTLLPNLATYPTAIATDAGGNVYVVGVTNNSGWLVRKGAVDGRGGISWSTVDLFSGSSGSAYPYGVFCHPSLGVFVVGQRQVVSGKWSGYVWTVRRSQDGGANWATVDTFQLDSSQQSYAYGVGGDSSGNIYVVGYAFSQKIVGYFPTRWIVRKTADGGKSWSTVDNFLPDFQPSHPVNAGAYAFGSDSNGNLFVAGFIRVLNNGNQWTVRTSAPGGGAWQTVDSFQLATSQASVPGAVIGNSSGNAFVGGYGTDAGRVAHWIVRKQ